MSEHTDDEGDMGEVTEPSGETASNVRQIRLAPSLNMAAAAPLHAELSAARGQDIEIHAGHVGMLGGQCLAILLAAQQAWQQDGKDFVIFSPTDSFQQLASQLGVPEDQLSMTGDSQ